MFSHTINDQYEIISDQTAESLILIKVRKVDTDDKTCRLELAHNGLWPARRGWLADWQRDIGTLGLIHFDMRAVR
jgi:hypothetical protein